ncbi:MAG TPA: type II toxin-antitoxin system HicA family toxin [Sphingomonas sp.]|jgi:mRNA interferase HicA
MNSDQFRRQLKQMGCEIEHGARHDIVRLGDRKAALPRHGGRKQLGTGLVNAILKDLGLR